MLAQHFFNRDASIVAANLIGKVIRRRLYHTWLSAQIIETEAYYIHEKGSHSSLGRTPSREAMFMGPGAIYMYHAHGKGSLNVSCQGEGNAVLIKSAYPFIDEKTPNNMLSMMESFHAKQKKMSELCAGQTLLCTSLHLEVCDWNRAQFDERTFFIENINYSPTHLVQAQRLGIAKHRDAHLKLRFIDYEKLAFCTSNPLKKRQWCEGKEYDVISTLSGKN